MPLLIRYPPNDEIHVTQDEDYVGRSTPRGHRPWQPKYGTGSPSIEEDYQYVTTQQPLAQLACRVFDNDEVPSGGVFAWSGEEFWNSGVASVTASLWQKLPLTDTDEVPIAAAGGVLDEEPSAPQWTQPSAWVSSYQIQQDDLPVIQLDEDPWISPGIQTQLPTIWLSWQDEAEYGSLVGVVEDFWLIWAVQQVAFRADLTTEDDVAGLVAPLPAQDEEPWKAVLMQPQLPLLWVPPIEDDVPVLPQPTPIHVDDDYWQFLPSSLAFYLQSYRVDDLMEFPQEFPHNVPPKPRDRKYGIPWWLKLRNRTRKLR